MAIKYFSMFSGIGGFEWGMEQSQHKFESVGYSEVDKFAISIYSRHFPKHKNFGDATKINTSEIPDFDFLVGGFPCQAFSLAGKRQGFDDTRGTLFFEIARVLKDKRPRHFLLENVAGLLYHDNGKTFQTIIRVLSDLGYRVKWEIFNSKNYGVPQSRKRMFIEGYSRNGSRPKILPFKGAHKKATNNIIGDFTPTRTAYYYPSTNTVAGTITATGQKSGGRTFVNVSNRENQYLIRQLTPKECERLQGFPDDWTKFGKDGELISDTQRYKCCGNAVTTNVITAIVNEMFDSGEE